jgi:hypothetical protein
MKSQYSLFKKDYPGKLCMDIGYNIEDILVTFKADLSYRDCYKNVIMTLTDYSNWLGPKAMWLDSCEFNSNEDLLIYSYNPWNRVKNSGDVSMLRFRSYIKDRDTVLATGVGKVFSRPGIGTPHFYRDCLVVDDDLLSNLSKQLKL